MAVLMEFAMFPTDKGISVSADVARVIDMIKNQGYPYQLTGMGTMVETQTVGQALNIVEKAAEILQTDAERIYSTIKLDIKKGAENMLETKVNSVESKLK